jgi:GPH family glycoside/pentoside/hexuronide:cation symporter
MTKQELSVGLGFFAIFFATQSIATMAVPYYHMVLGVDPFLLGATLTLPILISAVFNPWLGKLFDVNPLLQNRSWVVFIFGWLTALLFGAVWMAPVSWGESSILLFLFVVLTLFSLSLTILTLASRCIVFENIQTQDKRRFQFGVIAFFEKLGAIIYFWFFPISQLIFVGNVYNGVRVVGWTVAFFLIGILTSVMARAFRHQRHKLSNARTIQIQDLPKVDEIPKAFVKRVRLILFHVFLMFAILGLCVSLDYYLIVYFMFNGNIELGSLWKGILSTSYAVIGIAFIPIAIKVSRVQDEYRVLRYAYAMALIGGPLKWIIFQPGNEFALIIDALLGAAAWTAMATTIPTMLATLSEQTEKKYGISVSGYLNAKYELVLKVSAVVSLLVSGLILSVIGFDASLGANQASDTLHRMRLIFSVGSTIVLIFLLLLTIKQNRQQLTSV